MAKRKKKQENSPEFERFVQATMEYVAANPEYYSGAGIYEAMKSGLKTVMERLMQAELTSQLGYEKNSQEEKRTDNRRNGTSSKTVRGKSGPIELAIPRDRSGEFESRLIPKYKKDISDIEDKVIAMYARGMSERDIARTIDDIYGFTLSATTISEMTDSILPVVKQWKNRPLRKIYPFLFIDALYVDMKVERTSQKRAIYVMIGIDEDGHKDVLGFWNRGEESADSWRKIFEEIQSRGVEKVCYISADGLKGIEPAIRACFGEETVFQRCIVHMVRNSLKHLARENYAAFCAEIREVYSAVSLEAADDAFERFKARWTNVSDKAVKVWIDGYKYVKQLFNEPKEVRRVIYTTNTIESVNSALRKVTNLKGALPNEDALDKLLYLRIQDLVAGWKGPVRFWSTVVAKLDISKPGWSIIPK